MENTIKKNGMTNGIILGVFLVLLTTIMYVVDLSLFTSIWVGLVNFVIIVSVGVYTSIINKKLLKGIMRYKDAFLSFILPVIIGMALYTVYNVVLFNFIDPGAKDVITENIIKMTQDMMSKFNVPAADLEAAIEEIKSKDNFSPMVQLKSFFMMIAFYSVIGLVVALIFKTPTNKA